jgi:transcriptional regulator with XRE-family HTH domain
LSQEQLAERSGVSQRGINDMERGGQHVQRRDTVTLLARALDLSRPKRDVFEGLVERSPRLGLCRTCRESIRRRSSRNAASSG